MVIRAELCTFLACRQSSFYRNNFSAERGTPLSFLRNGKTLYSPWETFINKIIQTISLFDPVKTPKIDRSNWKILLFSILWDGFDGKTDRWSVVVSPPRRFSWKNYYLYFYRADIMFSPCRVFGQNHGWSRQSCYVDHVACVRKPNFIANEWSDRGI